MEDKRGEREFEEEITVYLLDYLNVILKHWKLIAKIFIGIVFLVGLNSFLKAPVYTAEATILPSTGVGGVPENLSGMKGIGSQFGISTGVVNLNSPLIFKKMLKSRELITRVIERKFPSPSSNVKKTLVEIFEIEEEEPEERLYAAYKSLLNATRVSIDNEAFTLTLSVNTNDAVLSAEIAGAMIEELDEYNREIRTNKAKGNKEFIEGRLEETNRELRRAEEELKRFRENNRRIQDSPELMLQLGRLERQVKLQEELFITLKKEYELAKIKMVKDTPEISILSPPKPPMEKSAPKKKRNLVLAGILSLFLGVLAAFGTEYMENNSKNVKNLEGFKIISKDFIKLIQIPKKIFRRGVKDVNSEAHENKP